MEVNTTLDKSTVDNPKTFWNSSKVIWVVLIVFTITLTLLIRFFLLATFSIEGQSMQPTLRSGDRVIMNRISYKVHSINRGDVVVIDTNVAFSEKRLLNGFFLPLDKTNDNIKRVIGLSGETITIRNCKVFINGVELQEPYVKETNYLNCSNKIEVLNLQIPENAVYVLGDNRDNSSDSRSYGPITEKAIRGRAVVRIWPFWSLDSL